MKKLIAIISVCLLGLTVTACGNSNNSQAKTNSSLKAENASLKAKTTNNTGTTSIEKKYSNAEYAMAAYLKLVNTDASSLQNTENMTWQQQGNRYIIGFGGHTTSMTVNENDVDVTYDETEGDHMGSGNGHKTYSKAKLASFIKSQKSDIDNLVGKRSAKSESQANTQNTGANNQTATATNASSNSDAEEAARKVCEQEGIEYHPERLQITPDGNGGYTVLARTVGSYHYSSNGEISKNPPADY